MKKGGKKFISILGRGHSQCLSDALVECWGKESYSDVVFVSKQGGERLTANKAVLAASSKKLAQLLADTEGDDMTTIIVPERDFTAIDLLLRYIYSGKIDAVGKKFVAELQILISEWVSNNK